VRIHGIRTRDTLETEPFSVEQALFFGWRGEGLLGAHNAVVENALLKQVWPHPCFSPAFDGAGSQVAEWGPWVDTLCLYQYAYPGLESYKLADLVSLFGLNAALDALAAERCPEGRRHWHCALYDALASALLLAHLLEQEAYTAITAEQLTTMSCRKQGRNQLNLF